MLPAHDHALSITRQLTPNLGDFLYLMTLLLIGGAARQSVARFGLAAVLLNYVHECTRGCVFTATINWLSIIGPTSTSASGARSSLPRL